MEAMTTLAAALAALLATWGAAGMPRAVDALLRHKARAMDAYWERMRSELEPYVDGGRIDGSCPAELVDWAVRQRAQVGGRKLAREQAEALKGMGLVCESAETGSLPSAEEARAAYRLDATAATRAACALACAAMPAAAAAMSAVGMLGAQLSCPAGALVLGAAAWAAMCAILACDIRAKLIPWQLCAALMALACMFALCGPSDGGPAWQNLLAGLLLGALAYAACKGVNGAMRFLTGAGAIGQGDLRLMPALCALCGLHGSLAGFAAATALMLALAVVALARGATRRDYIPYAPGLAAWALVGMLAQLACAGGGSL